MKKFNIDWYYMKKAMVVLATCFLVSSALVGASQLYLSSAMVGYTVQHDLRLSVEEEGIQLEEDIRLAKKYTTSFNVLIPKGFIGDERRLDWVETFREATGSMKLNKANYRIEPKQIATLDYIENSGNYAVYASKMNIQLDLLHESDLLYVINSMNKKAHGIFHIESCVLERKQSPFAMQASSTNLSAECWLVWYTLDVASQEFEDEDE